MRRSILAASVAVACGLASVRVAIGQVTLLGPNAIPHAISADGRTAVGQLTGVVEKAFVWTAAGGRYDFGQDPGMPAWSSALGVSQDGHTVVGASAAGPFRWQGAGTFQPIGSLPSPFNVAMAATGVSGDGSRVVGYGGPLVVGPFASFYWTQAGGMQQLPGVNGQALGVSRDGSRVVGSTGLRGFTWSPSGGRPLLAVAGRHERHVGQRDQLRWIDRGWVVGAAQSRHHLAKRSADGVAELSGDRAHADVPER